MKISFLLLLSFSVDVLKKKWKYLRDQFAVEFGKVQPLRSGQAAHAETSKWQHFAALMFLKDIVKPRMSSGNLRICALLRFGFLAVNSGGNNRGELC